MQVARASLHFWEEPPISGTSDGDAPRSSVSTDEAPGSGVSGDDAPRSSASNNDTPGSGTVFFTGCPLRCVYCQNYEISSLDNPTHKKISKNITPDELAKIFLKLQDAGALNINLVTPTHHLHPIVLAVKISRAQGLKLPIVWNTSGFETKETIRALAGVVDVYLTDFKYASAQLAGCLSGASDYPQVALVALREMLQQTGSPQFDEYHGQVRLVRGVIVRHLILPAHIDESKRVLGILKQVYDEFSENPRAAGACGVRELREGEDAHNSCGVHEPRQRNKDSAAVDSNPIYPGAPPFLLSLMNQYTPVIVSGKTPAQREAAKKFPELTRTVSSAEYEEVLDYADALGFEDYFWQDGPTSRESFIPAFDTTGV